MPFPRRDDISQWLSASVQFQFAAGLKYGIHVFNLTLLIVTILPIVVLSQGVYDEDGVTQVRQEGLDQIDRIEEALLRAGKISLKVGVVLLILAGLKKLNPLQLYYSAGERALKKAVRDVDELLKKIQAEAETASEEGTDEAADEGILAGMAEVAELIEAEDVPEYVLTVNDVMLDNVGVTLKRLRRFRDGSAERYKQYMFSVITGIRMVTQACAETGVASSLAVDIKDYVEDDHRYHTWQRVLSPYAKRGVYQEPAQSFLRFLKNIKERHPLLISKPSTSSAEKPAAPRPITPQLPDRLDETTLPVIQQAARKEAGHFYTFIQKDRSLDGSMAWQFELVQRQRQLTLRNEAQRMLQVFLSCERKALQKIAHTKMIPCRTWDQILYMLGVNNATQLQQRVDNKLLTEQEIVILEKAFLQTFAKKPSLQHIYGQGDGARVMMDLHIPQIRQEALAVLRRCYQTELSRLDATTENLDDEETPEHHEVTRLIKHYVYQKHEPPGVES